jgi:hypothetical protein
MECAPNMYWKFMERVSKTNRVETRKKVKGDGRERRGKQRDREYRGRKNKGGTRKEGERNGGGSKGEKEMRAKEEGMDGLRCCTPHNRRPQEKISKTKDSPPPHTYPCSPNRATSPPSVFATSAPGRGTAYDSGRAARERTQRNR